MLESILNFKDCVIAGAEAIYGGQGTSGQGYCNTSGGGDCTYYTYTDDCDNNSRQITSEATYDGGC